VRATEGLPSASVVLLTLAARQFLMSPTAGPEVVLGPMLLVGLGIGALASQLGSVTVSAVPDEKSPEVGGLQNTMTNLGASLGTALAGSLLIASLTTSLLATIEQDRSIPPRLAAEATTNLAAGVPFVSDTQIEQALADSGVGRRHADDVMSAYRSARIDGLRSALAILALVALIALFAAQRLPTEQPRPGPLDSCLEAIARALGDPGQGSPSSHDAPIHNGRFDRPDDRRGGRA
jgi:MFS family permease